MYLVKSPDHGPEPDGEARSIAGRLDLGMPGVADPANADDGALAWIVPARPEAISACAMAWIDRSGEVAEQFARFAADEVVLASRACVVLADCRTPGALALAQQGLFLAWAARVVSRTAALGALAKLSDSAAVTPFDNAATVNAERLSRYPGASRPTLGH